MFFNSQSRHFLSSKVHNRDRGKQRKIKDEIFLHFLLIPLLMKESFGLLGLVEEYKEG